MFPYTKYQFFYPPRPENKIPRESITDYDSNRFLTQPKVNGSNVLLFFNKKELIVMNRHGERMTRFNIDKEEILKLHKCEKGKWMVINAEYMNKAKNGINGELFNNKLIIFDILVYDNIHLIGKTFKERVDLLDELYGTNNSEDKFLFSISENIYRVKTFYEGLQELYDELILTDMYEGIVIKRMKAKLENGTSPKNNHRSQIKSRKKTKNYNF